MSKTKIHRKSEKWVNELKEKQQTTAMGWQIEADLEIVEAKFWSSEPWAVSRRTRPLPAVAVHL